MDEEEVSEHIKRLEQVGNKITERPTGLIVVQAPEERPESDYDMDGPYL
jgi:biotin operon repressor